MTALSFKAVVLFGVSFGKLTLVVETVVSFLSISFKDSSSSMLVSLASAAKVKGSPTAMVVVGLPWYRISSRTFELRVFSAGRAPEQTSEVEPFVPASLNIVRELYHRDVGHGVSVSLGTALWVPSSTADAQYVHSTTVTAEETPVVETKIQRKMRKLDHKLKEYNKRKASSSSESEDSSNDSTSSSSSSDIGDREYRATTQKTVEDIPPQQPGQEIAIPIDILGTNPLESAAVGPEIHAEIASRWTTFCRTGLDKDDRKSLIEKYPSPSNVESLSPPILNAEISACLTENLLKQDKFLSTLQKQIAAAMSAIALPMNVFFSNPSEEMNAHLQHLANGSKLLADVMHSLSRHRRYGLSNTMNNNIRKVVMDRPIEGFLFGEDLSNQIKTAQELKKSSKKGGGEQKEPEAKEKLEEVGVQKLVEYDYVLRKWWSYCTRHQLDPFSYSLQAIISFLAEAYKSGNSYSSVNTHKSALAMIFTFKEEDQCIIKRVLKGMYNSNPQNLDIIIHGIRTQY
nr:unnamed protein product [Callosobruchus analis]